RQTTIAKPTVGPLPGNGVLGAADSCIDVFSPVEEVAGFTQPPGGFHVVKRVGRICEYRVAADPMTIRLLNADQPIGGSASAQFESFLANGADQRIPTQQNHSGVEDRRSRIAVELASHYCAFRQLDV